MPTLRATCGRVGVEAGYPETGHRAAGRLHPSSLAESPGYPRGFPIGLPVQLGQSGRPSGRLDVRESFRAPPRGRAGPCHGGRCGAQRRVRTRRARRGRRRATRQPHRASGARREGYPSPPSADKHRVVELLLVREDVRVRPRGRDEIRVSDEFSDPRPRHPAQMEERDATMPEIVREKVAIPAAVQARVSAARSFRFRSASCARSRARSSSVHVLRRARSRAFFASRSARKR